MMLDRLAVLTAAWASPMGFAGMQLPMSSPLAPSAPVVQEPPQATLTAVASDDAAAEATTSYYEALASVQRQRSQLRTLVRYSAGASALVLAGSVPSIQSVLAEEELPFEAAVVLSHTMNDLAHVLPHW